jgi:hypothetical protein
MIHTYHLHGGAPEAGWLRWSCGDCPRVVDMNRQTGAISVIYAGAESCIHGGRSGALHIFDQPEVGAFEAGPWARAFDGKE